VKLDVRVDAIDQVLIERDQELLDAGLSILISHDQF
jgi:hypothetical protein